MLEFILEVILQLFGELILELVFELGFRAVAGLLRQSGRRLLGVGFGYASAGIILGAVSAVFIRRLLLHDPWMRYANLAVSPVLVGLIMGFLGRVRSQRKLDRIPLDTFAFGYLFALCFALARFFLAG
jgi:hypothetical protein